MCEAEVGILPSTPSYKLVGNKHCNMHFWISKGATLVQCAGPRLNIAICTSEHLRCIILVQCARLRLNRARCTFQYLRCNISGMCEAEVWIWTGMAPGVLSLRGMNITQPNFTLNLPGCWHYALLMISGYGLDWHSLDTNNTSSLLKL